MTLNSFRSTFKRAFSIEKTNGQRSMEPSKQIPQTHYELFVPKEVCLRNAIGPVQCIDRFLVAEFLPTKSISLEVAAAISKSILLSPCKFNFKSLEHSSLLGPNPEDGPILDKPETLRRGRIVTYMQDRDLVDSGYSTADSGSDPETSPRSRSGKPQIDSFPFSISKAQPIFEVLPDFDEKHQTSKAQDQAQESLRAVNREVPIDGFSSTNSNLEIQVAVAHARNAETEEQYKSKLADKEEQTSRILSMYQGLCAEHEELKEEVKSLVSQTSNGELSAARRHAKALSGDLTIARQSSHADRTDLLYEKSLNAELGRQLQAAYREIDRLDRFARATQHSEQQLTRELAAEREESSKLRQMRERTYKAWQESTGDFVKMKSEHEFKMMQNLQLRSAMEQDPGKIADMDNAIAHLKKVISDTEGRAMNAEEECIRLKKLRDEDKFVHDAELKAAKDIGKMCQEAAFDLLASKRTDRTAIDTFLETVKDVPTSDNLEDAFESYFALKEADDDRDTRILSLSQLHSDAANDAKVLRIKCGNLEATSRENQVRYEDLENELRKKSGDFDVLEIEINARVDEHNAALNAKDAEVIAANQNAARYLECLNSLKDRSHDAAVSWLFQHLEHQLDQAKAARTQAEARARDLEQKIHSMQKHQEMEVMYHYWMQDGHEQLPSQLEVAHAEVEMLQKKLSEYERAFPDLENLRTDGRLDENLVAELQEKVSKLEKELDENGSKFASRDWVKWSDHLARVNEVRARTMAEFENETRSQLENSVENDVTIRVGTEFVKPLIDLGGYFWRRIGCLERLLAPHYEMNLDEDQSRKVLMEASKRFQIDTSGGNIDV